MQLGRSLNGERIPVYAQSAAPRFWKRMAITTEILQKMVAEGGHIEVFQGSFTAREYIYVCRPDGRALFASNMPREMLDQLVRLSFVVMDREENERQVTIYRLTPDGKKAGTKQQQ